MPLLSTGSMERSIAITPPDQILYIVGNGFDLHHGIASSYRAFGSYLKTFDRDTYRVLQRYFSMDEHFWWEFEARLADLDTEALLDDAGQYLASYSAEDWSDSGHGDYQYELSKMVEALSTTLHRRFCEWARQLIIPIPGSLLGKMLPLRRDARYLTFNYTNTLQSLYGVPEANVVHIHGAALHVDEELILGHGWQRTPADSLNYGIDLSETDTRVTEGNDIVEHYFSETFKPTTRIIQENQELFQRLQGVKKIFVLGHSMSVVDQPYLRELRTHLGNNQVEWTVSFLDNKSDLEKAVDELGLPLEHVQFARLTESSRWACP